ncbi:Uncharacterised protein [[Clostridium] sordellii]|uniref:Uncharacterized protein n=2 Tax=Paraclostridium sordellii TaxID=1505 RepID=A0A9P1L108_PARSO|nr:hypothetical protein H476_0655 [[Clostridium] sordellii VPI 9048] [Paeniclostridium sordellii VPI 9048]MDU5021209.1 DUF3226 domain-containing protein [Clostridiales bacterium]CEK33245.1 hypothetical protein UMC2_04951 [[Clostridium] sordellii] [Paeniclostridium sordellii]CEK38705.1 conserved protein [[Clostridium] sordellii] [Paeniclostridium sordellii]CEN25526.1 Uncharacterised protein [[Clostridium] sordellii] [Paeniclostridium sordellii]
MMKNILFFVEGVHDANCVARILEVNNFKEIKNLENLPNMWKRKIPRAYPFTKDKLDRYIPIPNYFTNQKYLSVIICTNGEGRLLKEIDLYISNMNLGELREIESICAIFDADQTEAEKAFENKFKHIKKDMIITKGDFKKGYFNIKNKKIKLYNYFFPNNKDKGTLEDLLLESAKEIYSDLFYRVNEYIQNIDLKYKYNWTISSENKVKVGCIANVFQPGSANQNSIRHDDWISKQSIDKCKYVSDFYFFIKNIIT